MGLCQLVRRSCRAVVEGAELVTIDRERVASYAAGLAPQLTRRPAGTAEPVGGEPGGGEPASSDPELTAGLALALDAVNFGSGYHDAVRKRPGSSGARTMAAGLRAEIGRRGSLSTAWLQSLAGDDCARIFGQDRRHPEQRELIGLFALALRQLGRFVAAGYDGSFIAVVEAADRSAERLACSLLAMPFYRDRHLLDRRTVHFYKRAQITAADVARAFRHRPPADFADLHLLTSFADNLVPHVLRVDGVLAYDPELAAGIDAGERLEHGSRAEIEIRAAGVDAVELLAAELGSLDPGSSGAAGLRPMDLDLALWLRGGGARYKAVPRHRTRCVFY